MTGFPDICAEILYSLPIRPEMVDSGRWACMVYQNGPGGNNGIPGRVQNGFRGRTRVCSFCGYGGNGEIRALGVQGVEGMEIRVRTGTQRPHRPR